MTDSYPFPTAGLHPLHPCNVDRERERRDEEDHTDATLIMEAARRVAELQAFLDSLKPNGNKAIDVTQDAQVMVSDLHDYLEESARDISSEAYRDWCKQQARINKGNARLDAPVTGAAE